MSLADVKVTVGPDGLLYLRLPLGAAWASRQVRVVVDDVLAADTSAAEDWQQFIAAMAGSISDPSLVRHDA